jgi:hypothetical protein
MKIVLVTILSFFSILQMNGQTNPMDRLFKDKPKNLSIYVNPTLQYSQIALQRSTIAGIGAGVIINKKITLGAIYNLALPNISLSEASGPGKLQMKWVGAHFEYTLWPLQKVHLTFPISAGAGRLKIIGNTSGPLEGNPNFFFAETGMMIECNIWKYAKLGIGTSYRFIGNVSYHLFTSGDLSGFAAVVSVKFGMFRYTLRK